jgi:flagellar biosynthesis GTPase FlhF
VVVTAAIDPTSAKQAPQDRRPDDALSQQGDRPAGPGSPMDGIGRMLQRFTPITRTGQKKLQPKFVRLMNETLESTAQATTEVPERTIYELLRAQGLSRAVACELADKIVDLNEQDAPLEDGSVVALSQIIEAKGWVAPTRPRHDRKQRIIVLVGPNGAGKTTMAAKLAAQAVLRANEPVALLSLDDQRIAGTAELQKYADIMGLPFETASAPEQLSAAMKNLSHTPLVVVDTPGIAPSDTARQQALSRMLKTLPAAEVHLLINAGAQEAVISRTIEVYKNLEINRLLPTHLDWCGHLGAFVNQMHAYAWPITFLGTGPQVPDGLESLTSRRMAAMLLARADEAACQAEPEPAVMMTPRQSAPEQQEQYVANRNSDIFHDRACKSVQRINNDNAVIFKDPTDAMQQGYKPCRMCCMALFAPKPIDRLASHRFASSRN